MKQKNIVKNISYALKNIWKWDKAFYLYFLPVIPLSVFLPLLNAYIPKLLIDYINAGRSLYIIAAVIGSFFLLLFFCSVIQKFCNSRLNARHYTISLLYQNKLWEKFMRTDYSNTDNPDCNIKFFNAMNDACSGQCAPEFIWNSLLGLFINILGLFTYGSIISLLNPLFILFLVISSVFTYFISKWQRNYIETHKDKWAKIDRKINYLDGLSSNFDYAKDIRLFGMLDWLMKLLSSLQKDRFVWIKKCSFRSLMGNIINALITLLREAGIYGLLIYLFFVERIGIGDFIFYSAAIMGFSTWLNGIIGGIGDVVYKSLRIGYYIDYFSIPDHYNHHKGCALPFGDELPLKIELKDVSFQYPSSDVRTIDHLSLTIEKGEKLAIVGENGAGKSTLVKLICGLYLPTEGDILVNGKSIKDYNIEEYYTLFSVVFQDIHLLPVSIEDFIVSDTKNAVNMDPERLKKAIADSGLEEKISLLPTHEKTKLMKGIFDDSIDLSGGEKQKLMLARALYKNAPCIILDEPTAALDPIAESELYEKYNRLTSQKTSIYISHRLASTRFCDKIILLDTGKILEYGTHEELMMLNGKYASMFQIQSQYYKTEGERND